MGYHRKKIVLALIIFHIFILSGCWDREELNTMGVAGALAVEEKDGNKELAFEIYNPIREEEGGKEESVKFHRSSGVSFFDAIRNITMSYDKKIFFSHIKVIIVSEETAREGLLGFFDFWTRQHQPRLSTYILVAKDVSPSEVLSSREEMEDSYADYIMSLVKNSKNSGKTVSINILDFLKDFYGKEKQPIVGTILMKEEKQLGEGNKTGNKLYAEGAAVFSGDKLIGFIDGQEARGLNFVTEKMDSGVVVSPSPDEKGENSVEIINSESEYDVDFSGNDVRIKISIRILGALAETNAGVDTREPEIIKEIEKNNSQAVKLEVEHVIKKAQKELKTDIFGLGSSVHRQYPEKWASIKDQWNEFFLNAKIEVNVSTEIPRIGLINIPAGMEERK